MEVFLYFLKLGATVFGGVGPQLAALRRDLVEGRKWLTPSEFERGVALAYLCPGPVGTQAGVYCGWRRGGIAGAAAALLGFLLVPFLLVVGIAAAHARFGSGGAFGRLVEGMRCAVVPVIALSALRLFRALPGRLERAACLASLACCLWRPAGATWAVFGAGLALAALAGTGKRGAASLSAVFLLGLHAGLLVYGTGQAILPIVRQSAVEVHGWLSGTQFADAVSAGLVTPGPVVMAVAYVGFAAAGFPGAFACAAGAFLPAFVFVVVVGPMMEKIEGRPRLMAFARGATAGAIGGVAAAAAGLAGTALVGPRQAALAAAAGGAILCGVPDAAVVLAAGLCASLLL